MRTTRSILTNQMNFLIPETCYISYSPRTLHVLREVPIGVHLRVTVEELFVYSGNCNLLSEVDFFANAVENG